MLTKLSKQTKQLDRSHKCLVPQNDKMYFSYPGIYEPGGGTLLASKCVGAFQRSFVRRGGVIKDGEGVVEIVPGDVVTVRTSK